MEQNSSGQVMDQAVGPDARAAINEERSEILQQIEDWLEIPMLALSLAWIVLLIVDVVWGLSSILETVNIVIWILFIVEFTFRFVIAPYKLRFLRSNWLTTIALVAPGLRLLRIARIARVLQLARVTRGLRLLRVVSSLNRGMRALGAAMSRRGFGYVVLLTVIVALASSAGMLAFEGVEQAGGGGIATYGDALWWTAMALTTMGSDYFPVTPEGRVLGFIVALYAFAVFGYLTATLATFFVGRDAESDEGEIAGAANLDALHREMMLLREELRSVRESIKSTGAGG